MNYYLAVDIGASSGRHILGHLEEGKLVTEEIHRFPNEMKRVENGLVWDTNHLFSEILTGMRRCRELGKIPVSMGIDTWAVDYVLLDAEDRFLQPAYSYRDSRTEHMEERVFARVPEKELYARTGIQKQPLNTIYQLMAEQESGRIRKAETMLLLPDYFHFLLTGIKTAEYTNASTTQLLDPVTCDWNWQLIRELGFPEQIFQPVTEPGTILGELSDEITRQVGFRCSVVLPPTHDTASAVMAVPSETDCLYISSGTWSLMGTELMRANCTEAARLANLTNEGGWYHRFRFLKNIMGLWMIQQVQKEICPELSFSQLCELAEQAQIASLVDASAARFLAPVSMYEEIAAACREQEIQTPQTPGEFARVIYRSLARCYAKTALELETLLGKRFETLYIIGGGSNADYLNRLTAEATGMQVISGPGEATAVGNLLAQMIAAGELNGLSEARRLVKASFHLTVYGGKME